MMGSLNDNSINQINTLSDLLSFEDENFIRAAYLVLLGRSPEQEGLKYYLDLHGKGISKLEILSRINSSEEGSKKTVQLPGLAKAIRQYRWKKKIPLMGAGADPEISEQSLMFRAISNQINNINQLNEQRFERLFNALQEDKNEFRFAKIHQLLLEDRNETKLEQILHILNEELNNKRFNVLQQQLEDKNEYRLAKIHQLLLDDRTEDKLESLFTFLVEDKNEQRFADIHQQLAEIKNKLPVVEAAPVVRPKLNQQGFLNLEEDFNEQWYLNRYPEVRATRMSALEHFIHYGSAEGKLASSLGLSIFDSDWYLINNPDVAESVYSPLEHFIKQGQFEGRSGSYTSFRGLQAIKHESLEHTTPLQNTKVKLIAFYLPQFHPIAENDEWWGRGFTEWSNVTRATPFYEDHDQPRMPGELGFYDLRIPEVMQRQAELAKTHGIYGFCFYIYWFAGKRLLEHPVKMLLAHPEININFCYCWANENWTRRWDGLDEDVLIGQSHSPEDDINFIKEIAPAFADKRYIRVDGKPILLVYRPTLFPEIKATVARWRKWCLSNGHGELHICFTSSFNEGNPHEMGMDAAIQFPPLTGNPQQITDLINITDDTFAGQAYNYASSVNDARYYKRPDWLEYRGVMPSWDNTPRKMERGISFYGATPELYAKWLDITAAETCASLPAEQRFVFVNAWNEWAEGAYLEPDRRRGYAYLNKTRQIMAKYSDITSISKSSRKNDVAVVIHLFYEDLFEGLASYLDNFENQADFFFNVRENALVRMKAIIKQRYPDAEIVAYPNQGRDVLPFLYMLPYLLKLDYKAVCKIHSKKSKHREDGDNWRDDVLSKLLGSKAIISACFAQISSGAGIVAPSGHLLDGSHYWGSNANRVTELAIRMGCPQKSVDNFYFPAGNMFWFSPKAIKSLLSLNLTAMDFENEAGQVDGTTAHAIERLIGLAALKHGFRVEETAEQVSAQTQEYAYAEKTIPKK